MIERILWGRIDIPGHEAAELADRNGWQLRGISVFAYEGEPCRLDYDIRCDRDWLTESATIGGNVGDRLIDMEIIRNPAGEWAVNGSKIRELTDCDDVDLNFSPSTNMLPIRRLKLEVGETAPVRAAWVRFPGFNLEVLEQTYTRTGPLAYRYESAGGKFQRDITVDAAGFVLDYPGFFRVNARSGAKA